MKKILGVARSILDKTTEYNDTHPIYLLIKELVDIELHGNIFKSISTYDAENVHDFTFRDVLPSQRKKYGNYLYNDEITGKVDRDSFERNARSKDITETIYLGYDSILTRPWNIDRLIGALSGGTVKGEWQQNSNHKVMLFLPYGVSFVYSGNHSITKGIMKNEGKIQTTDIYNMGKVHYYIYTDGVHYFRTDDNSLYAPVNNFNLSIVFEIGGLIEKQGFDKNPRFHGKTMFDFSPS